MRKTLLCLVLLIAPSLRGDILSSIFFQRAGNVGGGWSITNQQTGEVTTETSITMTFANPLTSGSVILLTTFTQNIGSVTNTITDTAGHTYTSLIKTQWAFGTNNYFCATNTSTTASNVITFSTSPAPIVSGDMKAIELTNSDGPITCAGNIDVQNGNGTGSTVSTPVLISSPGGFTTIQNNDFIFGMAAIGSCTAQSAGSGFTTNATLNDGFQIGEYGIKATAGIISVTVACTSGTAGPFNSYVVAMHP